MKEQLQYLMENAKVVLSIKEEREAFRKLNAAKRKIQSLEKIKGRSRSESTQLWWAQRRHSEARDLIIQANFGLVVAMIKKTKAHNVEFDELMSEGMLILTRSVNKFKVSFGHKFSTYVCRALLNGFARMGMNQGTKHDKCTADHDLAMNSRETAVTPPKENVSELRQFLEYHMEDLSDDEQTVIRFRFGLQDDRAWTLGEVSSLMGISNENVRKIQISALKRLNTMTHDALDSESDIL